NADTTQAKLIHRKLTLRTHPDKGGRLEYSQVLNDTYDKYKSGTLKVGEEVIAPKKTKSKNIPLAWLLHYFEIEMMASELTENTIAFDIDTTTVQSFTDFYSKIDEIENLAATKIPLVARKYIEK